MRKVKLAMKIGANTSSAKSVYANGMFARETRVDFDELIEGLMFMGQHCRFYPSKTDNPILSADR
jgi:hypothetical protein